MSNHFPVCYNVIVVEMVMLIEERSVHMSSRFILSNTPVHLLIKGITPVGRPKRHWRDDTVGQ